MDVVVIILVLGALAVLIFKRFGSFVYYVAFVDIFLRLIDFLGNNIPPINGFINTYFPSSVSGIISMYSSGIFEIVLLWLLFANYVAFECYILKTFFKKK